METMSLCGMHQFCVVSNVWIFNTFVFCSVRSYGSEEVFCLCVMAMCVSFLMDIICSTYVHIVNSVHVLGSALNFMPVFSNNIIIGLRF